MERKVIQQNKTTLVVSLPKKWALANDVDKNSKIHISELGKSLVLVPKTNSSLTAQLDLSKIDNKRLIRILISDLYRKGFLNINIKTSSNNYSLVKEVIKNQKYLNADIFSDKKSYLTMSSFSEPDKVQYEKLFRKLIFILKELFNNIDDKELFVSGLQYANLLRRMVSCYSLRTQNDSILRTLILILRSFNKLNYNNIRITDESLFNKIKQLFEMTYEKLYHAKTDFEQVQKEYSKVEKIFFNSSPKKNHFLLWEILRNINLASVYIESLNRCIV